MRINGLNGANEQVGGMNMMQKNDSVSKNIQNQISNAQKQLQELSENKDMSIEEKMKKRQEIQQQITDLNNRLRQHQIEQRKEQQEKAAKSAAKGVASRKETNSTGLSQESMKAMISADSAVSQAQVQGSVATKMEGRAGVLTAEIKQDEASGKDVKAKKEELAEVQQKGATVESSQMNTLVNATKELEVASKAQKQTNKTGEEDISSADKKEKTTGVTRNAVIAESKELKEAVSVDTPEGSEAVEISAPKTVVYSHVDVFL